VNSTLCSTFVIDTIKANDTLEKNVQLGMGRRVLCNFEKRLENVLDHIFKTTNGFGFSIDIVEAWDLNQPTDMIRKELVITYPSS
jgi:hypothetical protein